jgi:hypothetical protein
VNAVMNLRVPYNAGNFLTSFEPVSFSRTALHGESKLGHPVVTEPVLEVPVLILLHTVPC